MERMESMADDVCAEYVTLDVFDGCVLRYYERFLPKELADFYNETFELLPFTQGQVRSGKENRQSCFCSTVMDANGALKKYSYSGKVNTPIRFSDEMLMLANTVSVVTGGTFNSCLANLYPNGQSNIGYHSDSERDLYPESMIASISLGAERWFDVAAIGEGRDSVPYTWRGQRKVSIRVKHGSMIVMGGKLQKYYKHQLRREAAVTSPRINLTFRHAV
jgi:alkylated DNA repair dioxygenase AlkB